MHWVLESKAALFSKEIVTLFLDGGADVAAKNNNGATGATPLHIAALFSKEIVTLFLDRGADINAKDNNKWGTPLHCAVEYGNIEMATLLLDRGADVDIKNNDGYTPLDTTPLNDSDITNMLTNMFVE